LAGLLDALGAAWESLSWEQKLGLMLFAGAMILLSGGTLGLAFEVGMGVATVLGSAHGAYAATREAEYAAWLWRTDRTAWRQYVRNARRLA